METPLRNSILERYHLIHSRNQDTPKLYHSYAPGAPRGATFLDPSAYQLSYVVLDGRRITPNTSSGIIMVQLTGHPYIAGDVVRLLYHQQDGYPAPEVFAEVRWMIPQDIQHVSGNPWKQLLAFHLGFACASGRLISSYFPSPELDVRCWKFREHMDVNDPATPPSLVPVAAIRCQLARGVYDIRSPRLWLTTSLHGVCNLLYRFTAYNG